MTPHKHAAVIKAWADGADIEFRFNTEAAWQSCIDAPIWRIDNQYRIKPKTIRYRLALITGHMGPWVNAVMRQEDAIEIIRNSTFIKWLGDWQEVEV